MSYAWRPLTSTPMLRRRSPTIRSAVMVAVSDRDAVHAIHVRLAAEKGAGAACQINLPGAERRGAEGRPHQGLVRHHAFVPGGGGLRIMRREVHRFLDFEAVLLERGDVLAQREPVEAWPDVSLAERGADL